LRAPLIAVISVGIAAAAPAVAISASTPSGAPDAPQKAPVPVKTDLHQPIGPVTMQDQTTAQKRHTRLERRFMILRHRADRLIARRQHRRPRLADTAVQLRWSNAGLRRSIRVLRKRIKRMRAALRKRRSGLTIGLRARLEGIAACESHGNPRAIGGGGAFRGKYQFTYGTWRAVGGRGDPAAASEAEQDRRAAMLLARSGSSPWPVCG
jgi:hypothetical protein